MKSQKVKFCVFSASLVLGFTPNAHSDTLVGELNYLLQNYPTIQSRASLRDAAREDLNAALGLGLPRLDFSGDTGVQRTDVPSNTDFRAQAGLTATYNLFDGRANLFAQETAAVLLKSTDVDLDQTRQGLLFSGIQAYLNLVLQNKLVEISRTNVKLVEQIKAFVEDEQDLGRMSQADLLQARARLSQSVEALTAYQGSQRQGQNRYYNLFQRVPTRERMQDPIVPTEIVPETLESAIDMARRHNSLIESAKLLAEAANNQIGAAEASLMPRVDLETKADQKYNVDGVDGGETEGSILFKMNWNLFDGGQGKARTRAAALRHNAAMMELRQINLDVEEQVRNSYTIIETERRRFRTLQDAESIAAEAFNARFYLMQSGEETIINVLDTALELLNVRLAVTTTDYAHRLANFQLLLATGQMKPENLNRIVINGNLQPAIRDDNQLIQKLAEGEALPSSSKPELPDLSNSPVAGEPMRLATTTDTNYDDEAAFRASFQSTYDAPFSDELLPETPSGTSTPSASELQSGFYIVLGSFQDIRYANERIDIAGIADAFIQPAQLGGTTYQRVLAGPYSKSKAEEMKLDALVNGISDSWIMKK